MGRKKVFLSRLRPRGSEGSSTRFDDLEHIGVLVSQPDTVMVIVMTDESELTIGECHRLQRALASIFGEPVSLIY